MSWTIWLALVVSLPLALYLLASLLVPEKLS